MFEAKLPRRGDYIINRSQKDLSSGVVGYRKGLILV